VVNNSLVWAAAWADTLGSRAVQSLRDERGQGIMEYGILIGGFAIVAGAAFTLGAPGLRTAISTFFSNIGNCITFSGNCS